MQMKNKKQITSPPSPQPPSADLTNLRTQIIRLSAEISRGQGVPFLPAEKLYYVLQRALGHAKVLDESAAPAAPGVPPTIEPLLVGVNSECRTDWPKLPPKSCGCRSADECTHKFAGVSQEEINQIVRDDMEKLKRERAPGVPPVPPDAEDDTFLADWKHYDMGNADGWEKVAFTSGWGSGFKRGLAARAGVPPEKERCFNCKEVEGRHEQGMCPGEESCTTWQTVQQYADSLPANWYLDSSLETWFPLSAKEFERTKKELATLRAATNPEGTALPLDLEADIAAFIGRTMAIVDRAREQMSDEELEIADAKAEAILRGIGREDEAKKVSERHRPSKPINEGSNPSSPSNPVGSPAEPLMTHEPQIEDGRG